MYPTHRRLILLALFASIGLAQTYTVVDLGDISAQAVNNSGQVVGWASTGVTQQAVLYTNGQTIPLGTLGASPSLAYNMNNAGQVVGVSATASGVLHAFLYSDGSLIDLGTQGGLQSFAYGINVSGQVVGEIQISGSIYHAFLYNGALVDLGTLGGAQGAAYGINNSGQIVGSSLTTGGAAQHAFLYRNGAMIDLGVLPGNTISEAFAINNSGQIVGSSSASSGTSHAFLYRSGAMIDLGTLGGANSEGFAINNSGQIVGYAEVASSDPHAMLYANGVMTDLNTSVTLAGGAYLNAGFGINDLGQIVAQGSDSHSYLLTPNASAISVVNPFVGFISGGLTPQPVNLQTILSSPAATNVAADGMSAVVLMYQSASSQPVTFSLSAGGSAATLAAFDPNYLVSPNPPVSPQTLPPVSPIDPTCPGTCTFLALLWGPNKMPVPDTFPLVNLMVTATQPGNATTAQANVALVPPPLLLIHDLWSSDAAAGFTAGSQGFYDFIAGQYPHNQIFGVDYTAVNAKSFDNAAIQSTLLESMGSALASTASAGIAAREVDIVAHGMGGLAARYFLSTSGYTGNPALLSSPIHKLITAGTPHKGTLLANTLVSDQSDTELSGGNPETQAWCLAFGSCTLANVLQVLGRPIDTGVQSLEPGSSQLSALSAANPFSAIAGEASTSPLSVTEGLLDAMLSGFVSGPTIESILGNLPNDTIATAASQNPGTTGQTDSAVITPVVHSNFCQASVCSDVGETQSQSVFNQAFHWLTGGAGAAPLVVRTTGSLPTPVLNLSGYSQVSASNVTVSPVTGTVLPIGIVTNITATSSTKTITELLLLQTVADPADTPLLYALQSPFTISFTPARLGTATFAAITVFSDNTYALTTLNYPLQASGSPLTLTLINVPAASLPLGASIVVRTEAQFSSGSADVTQVATYTSASGTANVFSVGADGAITATGNGVDTLNVSYNEATASAPVSVGACSYALSPSNQIAAYTGGTVSLQVTAPAGCSWLASGGASWLTFNTASGSGNGSATLTATPNTNTGAVARAAVVNLAGLSALVTQPATSCSYSLSQPQITAPASGLSGAITATTACPVISSTNQPWISSTPYGASVDYTVAPNTGTSQRTATLTIGTVGVPVTQSCTILGLILTTAGASGGPATVNVAAATGCAWTASSNASWLSVTSGSPGNGNGTVHYSVAANPGPGGRSGTLTIGGLTFTVNQSAPTAALQFVPVTPCRVADTRYPNGPFGGPSLTANSSRSFTIPASSCGIPSTALAYSLNVTVVPHEALGFLSIYPTGQSAPGTSTLNSTDARVKADAAIVPAGTSGAVTVYSSAATDVVLDINGYFVSPGVSTLAFYPMAPCRLVDTRNPTGPLGGPSLVGNVARTFPLLSSACGVPSTAQAYALNMTSIPYSALGYLATWPAGQSQPAVSTLNAPTAAITANAAIVPAGTSGGIEVLATSNSDLVVDINGYFAPAGSLGALSLYTVLPCRIADTRNPSGPLGGPELSAGVARSFPVPTAACGVPTGASAYSLNATVVPPAPLGFLTLGNSPTPASSTLNDLDGTIVSNAAIVPSAADWSIWAYASDATQLILDINGYFAP